MFSKEMAEGGINQYFLRSQWDEVQRQVEKHNLKDISNTVIEEEVVRKDVVRGQHASQREKHGAKG